MKHLDILKILLVVVLVWTVPIVVIRAIDSYKSKPTPRVYEQDDAPLDPRELDETNPLIGYKIVQFTAVWCGPCKQQSPIIDRMATEGYPVLRCDVDRTPDLAAKFQVNKIPTILFLQDGKVIARYVGVQSYETLTKKAVELRPAPPPKPLPPPPEDNDDSGLPVDKGRFPYRFQTTRPKWPIPYSSQLRSRQRHTPYQHLTMEFLRCSMEQKSPPPYMVRFVKSKSHLLG